MLLGVKIQESAHSLPAQKAVYCLQVFMSEKRAVFYEDSLVEIVCLISYLL